MVDRPSLSARVIFSPETVLGPGKADLLEAVEATGSICSRWPAHGHELQARLPVAGPDHGDAAI
jgi:hypothetical protein